MVLGGVVPLLSGGAVVSWFRNASTKTHRPQKTRRDSTPYNNSLALKLWLHIPHGDRKGNKATEFLDDRARFRDDKARQMYPKLCCSKYGLRLCYVGYPGIYISIVG